MSSALPSQLCLHSRRHPHHHHTFIHSSSSRTRVQGPVSLFVSLLALFIHNVLRLLMYLLFLFFSFLLFIIHSFHSCNNVVVVCYSESLLSLLSSLSFKSSSSPIDSPIIEESPFSTVSQHNKRYITAIAHTPIYKTVVCSPREWQAWRWVCLVAGHEGDGWSVVSRLHHSRQLTRSRQEPLTIIRPNLCIREQNTILREDCLELRLHPSSFLRIDRHSRWVCPEVHGEVEGRYPI